MASRQILPLKALLRTYKYRLYPTKQQTKKLEWILVRCCELYNAALQERKEAWSYQKKSISYPDQCRSLTEIKRDIRPEYQEIGAHVLQDVLRRLDKAYQNFFRRVKQGEKPGHPRFQGYRRYDSFTYPDQSNWQLQTTTLDLSKIGKIKIKLHRPVQGTIKTCTIKREGQHWYVCFSCEVEAVRKLPYTDEAVGVDLGLYHFAALSTGDIIENPRYYRRAEKQLKRAQEALSRKKRGSTRRKKAVQRIARHHRKIRNQRADFLHKHSRLLVETFETLVFEDLQAANMSKRPRPKKDEATGQYLPNGASAKAGLNKSIQDAGWAQFLAMCEYKAAWAGTTVLKVSPKYTSQTCSGCGDIRKKTLDERWHSCQCGVELDRDVNAAKNILSLGRRDQNA